MLGTGLCFEINSLIRLVAEQPTLGIQEISTARTWIEPPSGERRCANSSPFQVLLSDVVLSMPGEFASNGRKSHGCAYSGHGSTGSVPGASQRRPGTGYASESRLAFYGNSDSKLPLPHATRLSWLGFSQSSPVLTHWKHNTRRMIQN